MNRCRGLRKPLFSALAILMLLCVGTVPMATSDTPPGTPYYVYGFVEDESGPVAGAIVNLTLSTGGTGVAWNETATDGDGFYIVLFQSANVGDVITGRVSGVTNNLLVSGGPGGWLNFTYTHLEYTLSPGWNLISMGLLTSTLASDITSQTSTCLFIVNWSATAKAYTQTYARGSSEGDFTLVDGYGYWAYAETVETFNITGIEKTGPKTYTLVPGGWNLIGWTDSTSTTASELCNVVNDTYYGGVRGYITPWNTSRQEYDTGYLESSLFPPGAFPDITIQRKSGYWMWVSTATNWTPESEVAMGWSDMVMISDPESDFGFANARGPVIAVVGDVLHVAFRYTWGTFPNTVSELFYVRSQDGGLTWSEPLLLSNYTGETNQYTSNPTIAASGDHVYVVWSRKGRPGGDRISMCTSHDGGDTWSEEWELSTPSGGTADWPKISVDNDTVAVLWSDDRDKVNDYSLYMRIGTENGTLWGSEKRITISERCDISEAVFVRDNSIFVQFGRTFFDSDRYDVHFMKSDDLGETWTEPFILSEKDGAHSYGFDMLVDGTSIYSLWGDQKYKVNGDNAELELAMRRSLDGGDTWLPEQRLTHDKNSSNNAHIRQDATGRIHIFWADSRSPQGFYHMSSSDKGENWTTPEHIVYAIGSDVAIEGTTIHIVIFWNHTGKFEAYYMRNPPL